MNMFTEPLNLPLIPSSSTIRKCYSAIDGSPGFSKVVFKALETRFQAEKGKGKETLCALMLDEMSIMQSFEMCGEQIMGYVDTGNGVEDDSLPLATNAVVFMLVAIHGSWKVPVAHFMIKSLTGKEQANLVTQCLLKLHEIGVCNFPHLRWTFSTHHHVE